MYTYLLEELERYYEEKGVIRIGLAGTGFIGGGLMREMAVMKEFTPSVILYHRKESIEKQNATCEPAFIIDYCETAEEVKAAEEAGHVAAVTSVNLMFEATLDLVVDATGQEEVGAELAYQAIDHKVHVSASPEIDITIGPFLSRFAEEKGVVYSGFSGDEPGEIMNLSSYVKFSGLDIVAAGKFKRFIDRYSNPTTVEKWATLYKQNAIKLSSFADGTKMNIEMGLVANATGLIPDVPGMNSPEGTLETVAQLMQLKKDGGVLNKTGVIEIVKGVEPTGGVFVVAHTDNPQMIHDMKYYKMGDGPNYLFYKPYHLCVFEMLIGFAKIVVLKRPVIKPLSERQADVIPYAKKNLVAGEKLDAIGGYTFYGLLEAKEDIRKSNYVPISVVAGCRLKRDVQKDEIITFNDIEYEGGSRLWEIIEKEYLGKE